MKRLDIFIAHGRNSAIRQELIEILQSIKGFSIKTHILKDILKAGDSISEKIERFSLQCDLAIVLATMDDFVATKSSKVKPEFRARENVWIEYGYFWAKLGLSRTLLIADQRIKVPTNISNYYIRFDTSLSLKKDEIIGYIAQLDRQRASNLTEILYLNNNPNELSNDWGELHSLAYYRLIITGISFGNLRQDIPSLLLKLVNNKNLEVTIVALDPFFLIENKKLFKNLHGRNAVRDNLSFFLDYHKTIRDTLEKEKYEKDVRKRLTLKLFSGYFVGATVYCEDEFDSKHMIFQPFTYKARDRKFDYVRFRLKKRAENSAFDSIFNSLNMQMSNSRNQKVDYDGNAFLKKIKKMLRANL